MLKFRIDQYIITNFIARGFVSEAGMKSQPRLDSVLNCIREPYLDWYQLFSDILLIIITHVF